MKVFNIMFGALAVVIVGVYGACLVLDYLGIGFLSIFPALILGLYARRIVERLFGYTLEQAIKEDSDEK